MPAGILITSSNPTSTIHSDRPRGCIFEVVRPFSCGEITPSFATRKADGAAALVAARSSTANSMTAFLAMPTSTSAAIRLPSLGLLASSYQLHCLVRSALGFPPCKAGQFGCCDAGGCGSEFRPNLKDTRNCTTNRDANIVSVHGNADSLSAASCLTNDGLLPEVAVVNGAPATATDSADAALSAAVSRRRPTPPSPQAVLVAATTLSPGEHGGEGPYLFNEQFIVKPPRSSAAAAFGWHRDSDWCRDRQEYEYSPYVSVRCGLLWMT
ncbi:hypothetical protein Vretimale_12773 [Volvox reticuliferus]|uniref:Uncharacterized protein n=1 Tax=Volvox reticuliferus TaxID=1737510 RepID=A0A8J4GIZ2_9CHLO|nr:hypothetical protein Vretimale_12773 [Volvox reticuliferus]